MFHLQLTRTIFTNVLKSSVIYESANLVFDHHFTFSNYRYNEQYANISACIFIKCNSPYDVDGGALHLTCQNVYIRNSIFYSMYII